MGMTMAENIIDIIASDLWRLNHDQEFAESNPKLYTSKVILLDNFAKAHKLTPKAVQKLVKSNSFFKLGKSY